MTDLPQAGTAGPERVGLCILRVWRFNDSLLARLQMRADVDRRDSERVVLSGDTAVVLQAVEDFLTQYEH
jgi:hypothetical protein